jgi:hypothetical protein
LLDSHFGLAPLYHESLDHTQFLPVVELQAPDMLPENPDADALAEHMFDEVVKHGIVERLMKS